MNLVPRFLFGDLDLTDYPYAVEFGSQFGSPENVTEVLNSLLQDGELLSTTRVANREISLTVVIEGTDLLELAEAEAALVLEASRGRNTLTVDPGDGYAPPTMFETFRASLVWEREDNHEQANVRRFSLTIPALPYGHSVAKFVEDASSPPGAAAGTVFYAADSTTGWDTFGGDVSTKQFTVDTAIKVQGTGSVKSRVTEWRPGYVYNTGNGTGGYYSPNGGTSRDQVTGLSLDTETGGYVSVAIRLDAFYDASAVTRIWQSTAPGQWTEVGGWAAVKVEANGFVHYRWAVAADQTILGFRFEAKHGTRDQYGSGLPAPFVWYDDFRIVTTATTEQSIVKQLKVEGSAPTTGSLHIGAGSDSVALGPVLLVTMPSDQAPAGFNPEGRPWVTQGTLTTDATALQGSHYTPNATSYSTTAGTPIFNVPARMLTAGAYTMVSLVKAGSYPLVAGVRAQLNVNGTLTGPTSTAEVSLPSGVSGWQFVPLGTVYLPPVPVEGSDMTTTVRLIFKGAPMANIYMVPAWQVNGRPVADFSIVNCGTGTASPAGPSSHLWIDSPSARQPQGGWWRGPTPDRQNSRSAWVDVQKPGVHTFAPGELSAFLVTGAMAPTLALEYHAAWLNAAAL